MMELNAVNLVALGAASAVAGFSTGMTSFGRAILFHTAWMVAALVLSLNSDMSDVVAILSVQAVAVVGTLAWLSRKHLNLTLLAIMLPAAVTGILIGSNILISVEDSFIKLGLGVVVFGCALWRWGATIVLRRHHQRGAATVAPVAHRTIAVMPTTPGGAAAHEKQQPLNSTSTTQEEQQLEEAAPATESESATGTSSTKRQSLCARCRQRARRDVPSKGLAVGAGIAAFLSGLFAGIVGVAGPPLMIFVTVAQLDKSLVLATVAAMNASMSIPQAIYLCFVARVIEPADWPLLVVCVVGAMAGMVAGHRVHQYLSNAAVRVIILSLLSLAGCLLLGGGNLLRTVIAAAALIALVILFWALLSCTSRCCHPGAAKRRWRRQQRAVKPLPQP